jgi:hypothetical protein
MVLLVAFASYFGLKAYADGEAEKKVQSAIGKAAFYADITYGDVSFDLFGSNTRIEGLRVTPVGGSGSTEIDEVVIYDIDGTDEELRRLHMAVNGIHLSVEDAGGEEAEEMLRELGYDEIMAAMELDFEYEREEQEFTLRELSYRAEKMGAITLSCRLGNFELPGQGDFLSLLFMFPTILVHSAELRYEDDSLVPRLEKSFAEGQGMDVESYVAEITGGLEEEMEREKDELTREAMKAVRDFIKKPDTITVTISPEKPVPLGRLQRMEPGELTELLNLRIRG